MTNNRKFRNKCNLNELGKCQKRTCIVCGKGIEALKNQGKYKPGMHPNSRNGYKKGHLYCNTEEGRKITSGKMIEAYKLGFRKPFNYIDGKSDSRYKKLRKLMKYRLWREKIYKRDDWTCQKCRIKGTKLHPHHIKNFTNHPNLRFDASNGITFCENCHKEFHKSFGYKNISKENIKQFLIV